MISHIWNPMKKINLQNRNGVIDTENRLTTVKVEQEGGLGEKGGRGKYVNIYIQLVLLDYLSYTFIVIF